MYLWIDSTLMVRETSEVGNREHHFPNLPFTTCHFSISHLSNSMGYSTDLRQFTLNETYGREQRKRFPVLRSQTSPLSFSSSSFSASFIELLFFLPHFRHLNPIVLGYLYTLVFNAHMLLQYVHMCSNLSCMRTLNFQ